MGIPAVVALDYVGGVPFGLAIGLIALIAGWELFRMLEVAGHRPAWAIGLPVAVAFAAFPVVSTHTRAVWIGLILILVAGSAWYLVPAHYEAGLVNSALTMLPAIYVGLLLGHVSALRMSRDGAWWVVVLLVITWGYDTGAYFAGRAVGRHPFMAHVSPKKTVEGVIGGLVLAAVAGLVAVPTVGLAAWQGVALGMAGGMVVQTGDLVESMIKRQTGAKDSGHILPGHGGLLDRIDGLLFAAPLVFYAAVVFGYAA